MIRDMGKKGSHLRLQLKTNCMSFCSTSEAQVCNWLRFSLVMQLDEAEVISL
jgi:hypothetical protein